MRLKMEKVEKYNIFSVLKYSAIILMWGTLWFLKNTYIICNVVYVICHIHLILTELFKGTAQETQAVVT
jgi:hypothetical protein